MLVDNSLLFIDMVGKSKEIQKEKQVIIGNYYYDIKQRGLKIIGNTGRSGLLGDDPQLRHNSDRYIWVPTFNQLFNIFLKEIKKQYGTIASDWSYKLFILENLHYISMTAANSNYTTIDTINKALLLALHFEMYNKIWIDNAWVESQTKKI